MLSPRNLELLSGDSEMLLKQRSRPGDRFSTRLVVSTILLLYLICLYQPVVQAIGPAGAIPIPMIISPPAAPPSTPIATLKLAIDRATQSSSTNTTASVTPTPPIVPPVSALAAELSSLPTPPSPLPTPVATIHTATASILESEQNQRHDLQADAAVVAALSEKVKQDALEEMAAMPSSHVPPEPVAPNQAERIAREVAAHEMHIALHDAEDAEHEHSTHEIDALATHHGTHETTAEHQTFDPKTMPPAKLRAKALLAEETAAVAAAQEARRQARILLRRMAADRVAQAKQAVHAALHRQRFAEATTDGGVDHHYQAHQTNQNLFEIDHSRDDEPDDDVSRDKSLLKYAMDQLAAESKKKNDEVAELLAALKEDHVEKHEVEAALKESQQQQPSIASNSYAIWIILAIVILCLCICIPIVWIYWLKTWVLQNAPTSHHHAGVTPRHGIQYRSINAGGNDVQTVEVEGEDEVLILDEDDVSQQRHIRFDARKKVVPHQVTVGSPRVVVVKKSSSTSGGASSSKPSRSSSSGNAAARKAQSAARDLPDFDENDYPPTLRPYIEDDDPADDEDMSEEASMIGGGGKY